MLAVNNQLSARLLNSPSKLELITISLHYTNKTYIVCLLYIPPHADEAYHQLVQSHLLSLSDYNNLIIIGDTNFPDITWDSFLGRTHLSSSFCELVFELNLFQSVTKPTHVEGNILDIVLTNFDILDNEASVQSSLPPGLTSDHFLVLFTVPSYAQSHSASIPQQTYNYTKADWEGMLSCLLQHDFNSILQYEDIEYVWSQLKHVVGDVVESFVPKVSLRSHQYPKWFTPALRHELNEIHTVRRKCRRYPIDVNQRKLIAAECHLQESMKEAKQHFESTLINSFAESNSNRVYKYISSITKSTTLPTTMYHNNNSSSDNQEKADLFNSFFYSVFTRNPSPVSADEPLPTSVTLNEIEITSADTYEILSTLDPNKSMGIDNISPKVLKYCATALAEPIRHLFSLCFSHSYLPLEWRKHCIIPVYKSGDKTLVSNYRPISLLCITSKVLERIVYNKTMKFFSAKFNNHQFGFLPGRSSLQQMLLFINDLLEAKESKCQADTIYLDFRKAFDTVPHNKLLNKLKAYGITGNLWKWFQAYLNNRIQCVRINNGFSDSVPVLSGVPQGSLLGPLLFAIYINDMPNALSSACPYIFADDTKCLKTIRSKEDITLLQRDLDSMSNWSLASDLLFNESKCVHLPFWRSDPHEYCLNGKVVKTSDCIKDLGLMLTSDLNWSKHYQYISSRAYKILGLLRRTFTTESVIARKKLFISLVRSQLLYCSQVWRPQLIKDIVLLERIQKRATKYILNDYSSPYKCRLIKLDLLPLMYIYELNDLIFFIKAYKSPTNFFDIKNYISFTFLPTRSSTYSKLQHRSSSSNLNRHFYFCRLPRLWNSLPQIDISLPVPRLRSILYGYFRSHFINSFTDDNTCSLHYFCPCCNCSSQPRSQSLQAIRD